MKKLNLAVRPTPITRLDIFILTLISWTMIRALIDIYNNKYIIGINWDTFSMMLTVVSSFGFIWIMFPSLLNSLKKPFTIERSSTVDRQRNNKIHYILFLLGCFLPEHYLGDLQEEREERIQTYGLKAANRWYKQQVFASLWPQLCRVVVRMVSKIAR